MAPVNANILNGNKPYVAPLPEATSENEEGEKK